MDATVFFEGKGFWRVTASPSMRGLGDLVRAQDNTVTIEPDDGSDLQGIHTGPYATLEDAMDAIASHLKGQCQFAPKRGRF